MHTVFRPANTLQFSRQNFWQIQIYRVTKVMNTEAGETIANNVAQEAEFVSHHRN